jgi:hypothetical protein
VFYREAAEQSISLTEAQDVEAVQYACKECSIDETYLPITNDNLLNTQSLRLDIINERSTKQ